jgi:hypothetical protein
MKVLDMKFNFEINMKTQEEYSINEIRIEGNELKMKNCSLFLDQNFK